MKILKRRHPHPEIPLVSTADVSFLLLIFFLSTTIFAAQRGISLELPGPGERPVLLDASRTVRLAVNADRSVELDGAPVAAGSLSQELRARLRQKPDLLVHVTVDSQAPYAALVEALDQVKLSGARQVSLQTSGAP